MKPIHARWMVELYNHMKIVECTKNFMSIASKVSKYGVFSGPYFPIFERNTEIYSVNLCIQSEYREIWTRRNHVFRHFSRSGTDRELLKMLQS